MPPKSSTRFAHKGEVDLNWVLKYLKDGIYPPGLNFSEKRMVRKRAERFCYLNGELFYLGTPTDQDLGKKTRKVLLTHQERWNKVEEAHASPDGTHNGLERTADAITSEYHWNGIYKFIKDFIRQCAACREKRPNMLRVTQTQATSSVPNDGGSFTTADEEIFEQKVELIEVQTEEQTERQTEQTETESNQAEVQAKNGVFWEKVELRLLGPYKVRSESKHIMVFVDCFTKWCEAFVIDSLSPASVAHSILMVISRYGTMSGILMSKDDEVLEDSLVNGLEMLDTESNIQIPFLMEDRDPSTDSLLKELEVVTEKFVKKYPNNWNQSYEFCLAPFRASCNKKSPHLPTHMATTREPVLLETTTQKKGANTKVTDGEKIKSADALMSIQANLIVKDSTVATPIIRRNNKEQDGTDSVNTPGVYVTRSRTGKTKPKNLDEDNYESSTPKRKPSATDTPSRKRMKIEIVHPPQTTNTTTKQSDGVEENDEMTAAVKDKKSVDLDVYYKAIIMYVKGQGYPANATNSFKRLIRDQARNYSLRDDDLYHEVANRGIWKKIITTKKERVDLLTELYQKNYSKSKMFMALDDVHWKGKLVDCEAFVLASPYGERHSQKPFKDVTLTNLTENKKLLKFDTVETYREIKYFVVSSVYSSRELYNRLDELKKQIKLFKVEKGELIYTMGNKNRKVLMKSADRQKAVKDSLVKKGDQVDLTASFAQLAEKSFWFGMKFDLKVYMNYCCNTSVENRTLVDRYFLFREHFMRNYLHKETPAPRGEEDEGEEDELGEVDDGNDINDENEDLKLECTEDDEGAQELQDEESVVDASPKEKTATTGIFESTVEETPPKDLEKSMPNLRATLAAVESSLAMNAATSGSIVTEASTIVEAGSEAYFTDSVEVSETVDADSHMITEETVVGEESVVTSESQGHPGRIILKVSDDGQSVLVSKSTGDEATDDYTVRAVKSILPGEQTAEIITQSAPKTEAAETEEMQIITLNIEEQGDDGDDDSDENLYDTDEGEDGYLEGELASQSVQGLGAGDAGSDQGTPDGGRKPRPHFKCSQCHKVFFGPLKFKMHMYKHTGNKPFPCTQCNKKYTNKKSLVIHQRTHTGDLPYQCTLCGKRCPSKIALKSHLKCHDGNGGGFPAVCDICGREFTRKHLMERHKLHKHTNHQTEFKCQDCNKVFGHHRSLKRHYMSTHMGVKNHVCTLCGKRFYRKEYLTGHLLQHGGTAAEGLAGKKQRVSSFKPRASLLNPSFQMKEEKAEETPEVPTEQVQRIILHQDENGQLRVVDLETEREVKRMLDQQINQGEIGETMVVHIEEPSTGEPQVVHVEQTDEQVVEVPIEGQEGVEYQLIQERPQEYVISGDSGATPTTQYIYATSSGEIIQSNQDLYGQPAVQYEVECVGDVGDEEALSAINLLAQASAQQYETVISQI